MKARLRQLWGILRTLWWVLALIVVGIVIGWVYLVKKREKGKADLGVGSESVSVVDSVARRIVGAVTDVKVEQAIIDTKSDARKAELEEIKKEPDGKKRREKLAAILNRSI